MISEKEHNDFIEKVVKVLSFRANMVSSSPKFIYLGREEFAKLTCREHSSVSMREDGVYLQMLFKRTAKVYRVDEDNHMAVSF